MDNPNKYANLFSEDMTSEEALYTLYSHTDGLSEEERDLLWQAYLPVSHAILKAELDQVKV